MKTIKSKKSDKKKKKKYDDFEDLFDEIEKLDNKICKKKNKKKSKKASKSLKKKKNINKLTDEFFGIEHSKKKQKILDKNKDIKQKDPGKLNFAEKVADMFNFDTKIDIKITDESVNTAITCLGGLIAAIFLRKRT